MAKKQTRIRGPFQAQPAPSWLGRAASVVLMSGAVFEVNTLALEGDRLLGKDHSGLSHSFPFTDIRELILDYPVVEHAQTPAN
ncbi:hypothetical protein [Cesiribacter andamanensis]|uniref:Uncharacterized protein n=1 Tax=Cesiribacter andamanensis AMV16 TaxID=1279009 RepID=M7NNE3_9BACT|nr:hypothetical protein [Cesiribacter andamanensis]EMR03240.1 hypothetical protein ADICEAN_01633 [Cesiribacter andamanensis AMV16]